MTKLNFGAAKNRDLELELRRDAFLGDTVDLKDEWLTGVDRLVGLLEQGRGSLNIVYRCGQFAPVANDRVQVVKDLVAQRWQAGKRSSETAQDQHAGGVRPMMKRALLRTLSTASALTLMLAGAVHAQDADAPFKITVDGEVVAGDTLPPQSAATAVQVDVKFDGLGVRPMLNVSTVPMRASVQGWG